MQVISKISFPYSEETANLYFQGIATPIDNTISGVKLNRGEAISTNSYFNSFYESFYAKYTKIESIYYHLKLEGDFQIFVYREIYGGQRELILQSTLKECQAIDCIKIALPNLQQKEINRGRVYFELQCLSDRGTFVEGVVATDEEPPRTVSLAIISCTFKKEVYIKNTVQTVLQDNFLAHKSWTIFVVDNGQTLSADDFSDPRVKLIPNHNVGGSGGFTKGMVTALQLNTYSHLLLMDDDIILEPQSVYRLFTIYEYAREDFAVAGSMLDLYKKHILYEAGAAYDKDPQSFESAPFRVAPLKHNLELQKSESLNLLLLEEEVDYGGFWFFALPSKFVEDVGFLLPFFIKVDDMEFGIRIKRRLGKKIVAFPSIAVWHEPFYSKIIIWDSYYYARNNLIARTMYGTIEYINTLAKFSKDLISSLLIFEYNYAEMLVRAFEDYIKGPSFLKNNNPEELHKEVVRLSKSYKTQVIQQNYHLEPQTEISNTKAKAWKKTVSLLTLNGHLLPNFIKSDGEVFFWQSSAHAGTISRAFRKKKATIYREDNNCLFQNELDKSSGINLLSRWIRVVVQSSMRWSNIKREWKTAAPELSSTDFWQQYLNLEKSN